MQKHLLITTLGLMFSCQLSQAAIKLDRTRVIFSGNQKAISLNISNENDQLPYLAQGWIEDEHSEKLKKHLVVLPPVQRVEPGAKSLIRIEKLPDIQLLPQDRESVFYFSLREIPPKSNKENVLQLALQTKVKLFYRPEAILPKENDFWQERLEVKQAGSNLNITNPTPYYIVVLAVVNRTSPDLKQGKLIKGFDSVMIEPFGTTSIANVNSSKVGLVFIDDYGGRPEVIFDCTKNAEHCTSTGRVEIQ